jgi:hypothetical protein
VPHAPHASAAARLPPHPPQKRAASRFWRPHERQFKGSLQRLRAVYCSNSPLVARSIGRDDDGDAGRDAGGESSPSDFIANNDRAIELGKTLFWDSQAGGD